MRSRDNITPINTSYLATRLVVKLKLPSQSRAHMALMILAGVSRRINASATPNVQVRSAIEPGIHPFVCILAIVSATDPSSGLLEFPNRYCIVTSNFLLELCPTQLLFYHCYYVAALKRILVLTPTLYCSSNNKSCKNEK